MLSPRYLSNVIEELALDHGKMAFISGPRQCGKTSVGRLLASDRGSVRYANWDQTEFRRLWAKSPGSCLPPEISASGVEKPLLILDEIHKARHWKRTLKGIYDTLASPCDIVVTGSARLNTFKKGSDSLLGRYFQFRLHPFSIAETVSVSAASHATPESALENILRRSVRTGRSENQEAFERLFRFGGFPEVFLKGSERFSAVWRRSRIEKLVREDLRDLSRIQELSQVETLVALLPERVSGLLSLQSLREDLEVSHPTVKNWLNYLKELYYCFELKPRASSIPRALKKEGKIYLWDWAEVEEPAARFENLVASHLLKACHFWTDSGYGTFDLHYLRDKQKREVDFLLTRNRKPWLAVEAKLSDLQPSSSLIALGRHFPGIPKIQIVKTPGVWKVVRVGDDTVHLVNAADALAGWV